MPLAHNFTCGQKLGGLVANPVTYRLYYVYNWGGKQASDAGDGLMIARKKGRKKVYTQKQHLLLSTKQRIAHQRDLIKGKRDIAARMSIEPPIMLCFFQKPPGGFFERGFESLKVRVAGSRFFVWNSLPDNPPYKNKSFLPC